MSVSTVQSKHRTSTVTRKCINPGLLERFVVPGIIDIKARLGSCRSKECLAEMSLRGRGGMDSSSPMPRKQESRKKQPKRSQRNRDHESLPAVTQSPFPRVPNESENQKPSRRRNGGESRRARVKWSDALATHGTSVVGESGWTRRLGPHAENWRDHMPIRKRPSHQHRPIVRSAAAGAAAAGAHSDGASPLPQSSWDGPPSI